jgi:hypothetical protein
MNLPMMDKYLGSYTLINRWGHATAIVVTVVSTRNRTGTGGGNRGYMVLQDQSVIPTDKFLDLVASKQLVWSAPVES